MYYELFVEYGERLNISQTPKLGAWRMHYAQKGFFSISIQSQFFVIHICYSIEKDADIHSRGYQEPLTSNFKVFHQMLSFIFVPRNVFLRQ
jgi:hypothetical protein